MLDVAKDDLHPRVLTENARSCPQRQGVRCLDASVILMNENTGVFYYTL